MVSVVVPALNEENNLRDAVQNILAAANEVAVPIEIIVVNDGSTDKTGEIADQLAKEHSNVRAVHHQTNSGLGSALLDGMNLAKFSKITLFPGDNAVHPYTMRNVFKNAHRADMVLAYIVNTEARTWLRLVLSSFFTGIYCISFNIHLKYINGAPLYSVEWLRKIDKLNARRYSLLAEIHVKLMRMGVSFLEIDGYLKPSRKSSALKLNSLIEVIRSYLLLLWEVYVAQPNKYKQEPKRVLPYDETKL